MFVRRNKGTVHVQVISLAILGSVTYPNGPLLNELHHKRMQFNYLLLVCSHFHKLSIDVGAHSRMHLESGGGGTCWFPQIPDADLAVPIVCPG